MLCQECKKNNAVYFYSENINGKTYSVALCEDCKKRLMNKDGDYSKEIGYGMFDSFLFPSLFDFPNQYGKISREKRCEKCNSSFSELAKGKRAFCPECYNTFHSELSELLISIHGSDKHVGKHPILAEKSIDLSEQKSEEPKRGEKFSDDFSKLKEKLNQAIKDERYEDAAKIRDEIKKKEEEKK